MSLITSVVDPVVSGDLVTIEVEGGDSVTDVNLHSPSGDTVAGQEIVSQDSETVEIVASQDGVPYTDSASLELVSDTGNDTQTVAVEPADNLNVVDITETPATDTVCDPYADLSMAQGDQVIYVGADGQVLPDGSLDTTEPIYVQIWDASTETWSEPKRVDTDGTGAVVEEPIPQPTGSMQRDAGISLERGVTA